MKVGLDDFEVASDGLDLVAELIYLQWCISRHRDRVHPNQVNIDTS
jgi:hypothetical protein